MKKIIDFLGRLAANNEREWFNAHKSEYLECKAEFDVFVEQLIAEVRKFDDSIGALTPADCTYRIYRDTRFSNDKRPYKLHFGAFICPEGKKSPFGGYYFQVGCDDSGYDSGCMLAVGDYICDPKVIKILREDIAFDGGAIFTDALAKAKKFELDWDGALKRCPAGFPADKPYSRYFRLKNFCLVRNPGVEFMLKPELAKAVAKELKTGRPFLSLLNRAIAYSLEEE